MSTLATVRRILSESAIALVDYNTARNAATQHGFDPDAVVGRFESIVFNKVPQEARRLRVWSFEMYDGQPRIVFYDELPTKSKTRPILTVGGKGYQAVEVWWMPSDDDAADMQGASSQSSGDYDRKRRTWVTDAHRHIIAALRRGTTLYSRTQTHIIPLTSVDYVRLSTSGTDIQVMERGKWVTLSLDQIADIAHHAGMMNTRWLDEIY